MGKLIYSMIMSLDGFTAAEDGSFDWAAPSEEVHAFINDLVRPVKTHLYGRRMYEMMAGWETDPTFADHSPVTRDFAEIWKSADKIVYSRTLESVSTLRTRIEREFVPEAVRILKRDAPADLSVSGPGLAAHAINAGLVDEWHFVVAPVLVIGKAPPTPGRLKAKV